MIRLTLYFVLAFFTSFSSLADGPPIDSTGHISCNYISIQLNKAQIKQLQAKRWLILTEAQKKQLHFRDLPKYIDIFDPFHKDCVCGQIYAMWYLPDRIGFCIGDTSTIIHVSPGEDEIYDWYNNDTNFVKRRNDNDLYIGTAGQLFYKEKMIAVNDIPKIIETLKKSKGNDYLAIFQPPTNNNPDHKAILQMKQKIRDTLPKEFSVLWL